MALRLGAGKVRPSYSYKAQCTRCRVSSDEGSAMAEIKPFQDSHQCSAETATTRKRPAPLAPQLMNKDGTPLQGKRPPSDIILTSQWIEPASFKISIECDWCHNPVAEKDMKEHDKIDCMNPQPQKTVVTDNSITDNSTTVGITDNSITVGLPAVSTSKKRNKNEDAGNEDYSPSTDENPEPMPKKSRRFKEEDASSASTIDQYKWCQYHPTTNCRFYKYTNTKGKLSPTHQKALDTHEAKCKQLYDSIMASQ